MTIVGDDECTTSDHPTGMGGGPCVLCLGCSDRLIRSPDLDPSVPLQYCEREICQQLAAEHQAYIDARAAA